MSQKYKKETVVAIAGAGRCTVIKMDRKYQEIERMEIAVDSPMKIKKVPLQPCTSTVDREG